MEIKYIFFNLNECMRYSTVIEIDRHKMTVSKNGERCKICTKATKLIKINVSFFYCYNKTCTFLEC